MNKLIVEPTLKEQVAAGVRASIIAGHMAPGEVHSAPALAERYAVSVTPVREALLDLVKEGLLKPVKNKGFRVVEPSVQDLDEIASMRDLLEPPAVAMVANSATPEQLSHLRELAVIISQHAAAGKIEEYLEADRQFHLAVIEATGNKRLVETVAQLRSQARLFGLRRIAEKGELAQSSEEHNLLLHAIENKDAPLAEKIMRDHLGHVRHEWR